MIIKVSERLISRGPDQLADLRLQLVRVGGLGQVGVGGPGHEGIPVAGEGRVEDDRDRVVLRKDTAERLEPVHPRHLDVQHDQIRPRGSQMIHRFLRVGRENDLVALVLQLLLVEKSQVLLVVHHENRLHVEAPTSRWCGNAVGRHRWNVVPVPSTLSKVSVAWCWATSCAEIASPRPDPPGLVVKKERNTRSRWRSGMPTPVSAIEIFTWFSPRSVMTVSRRPSRGTCSSAWMALRIKFVST